MAKKPAAAMTFDRFTREYGVVRLAYRLGVHTSAIYHWLSGSTSPRVEFAFKIIAIAEECGVKLTLEEIYRKVREAESVSTSKTHPQPAHA